MTDIFRDLFLKPDITNRKQIRDILLEERNSLSASIIGSGHNYAMLHASSQLSLSRYINELIGGISQLRFLDPILKNDRIDDVIEKIGILHSRIVSKNACVVSVTAEEPQPITGQIAGLIGSLPAVPFENRAAVEIPGSTESRAIEISSAVNFVARAWKLGVCDPYCRGQLFLMARNLSTGYLWDKIRVEGGAYGGMAVTSISHPVFFCASYRDPNIALTLERFTEGLEEICNGLPADKIEQSIIGAIGRIDVPRTPHALGLGETMDLLLGYTTRVRQEVRDSILGSSVDSLKETAKSILGASQSAVTVLGSASAFDTAEKSGLVFKRESLIG